MPDPNESLSRSDRSESKRKAVSACASHFLEQLAVALDWKIPELRERLYLSALDDLEPIQIEHGFTIALKDFKPLPFLRFPLPGQIREWCLQFKPAIPPPHYEYEDTTLQERTDYSTQLIEAMREKIVEGAFRMPDYREAAESLAAARNGESKIPTDPEAKKAWGIQRAKELLADPQPLSVDSRTVSKEIPHGNRNSNKRRP
jgi:hypothetical protein